MGKLKYVEIKSRASEFLALTSLTVEEFEILGPHFEKAFQVHMSKWCVAGKLRKKRRYTTYETCPLATAEERLLFVMSYTLILGSSSKYHCVLWPIGAVLDSQSLK